MDSETNHNEQSAAADESGDATGGERLVPVTEAIRYRRRAQQAEQSLEASRSELTSLREALDGATQTIERLERRQRIDQLLGENEAVDVEVARLLTETAVAQMDEPDVQAAVAELRRHKPYLFGRSQSHASAMPARTAAISDPVDHAAHEAASSGNRRDLLRYLRLRREE